MARIVRSAPARQDISDIYQHLARITEALYRAAEPRASARRSEHRGAPRRVNVYRYSIFFEPLPEGGIFVWRVLHGARARYIRRPAFPGEEEE